MSKDKYASIFHENGAYYVYYPLSIFRNTCSFENCGISLGYSPMILADIRVTPRLSSLAVAVNWVFAYVCRSLLQHIWLSYFCIPMIYDVRFPIATHYSFALSTIALTFYLVTIPLYVHIYTVVKRSSQQMGVQRESTLAKRIAILVGTNLVFFFLPILSLGA